MYNKTILSLNPLIYTIDNFITDEECDHFINLSTNRLQRAFVSEDTGPSISSGRTGQNYWIPHLTDTITKNVADRISDLVDYPLKNAESFQLIYYDKMQNYNSHLDGWKFDKSEKSRRCLEGGGQRMITALVYLNNVESGGETKFTKLKLSVSPFKGRLLVFHNCIKGTNIINNLTEHSGSQVLEGHKYAFNLWFRQYPLTKKYIHNYENDTDNEPENNIEQTVIFSKKTNQKEGEVQKEEEVKKEDKIINYNSEYDLMFYFINLDKNKDRLQYMLKHFEGCRMERFSAIYNVNGWKGVIYSNAKLLDEIYNPNNTNNINYVRQIIPVLEDDCNLTIPLETFKEKWIKYRKYLFDHYGEWDFFSGGGIYLKPIKIICRDPFIIECKWSVCAQFMVHSDKTVELIKKRVNMDSSKWEGSYDTYLAHNCNKIWVPYPMFCRQENFTSNIGGSKKYTDLINIGFDNAIKDLDDFVAKQPV
jgi:prolyl 4-hydroxylase